MRVIFLSEKRAALTVSGLYLGLADGFERSVELDPAEKHFIELKPEGFHAVRFRLDDDFLTAPPPQVDLYFTRLGIAVYCRRFLRQDASLHVIRQERLSGTQFTLFVQGRVELSMENETGLHLIDLPDEFEQAALSAVGQCFLLEGEGCFCILARDGTVCVRSEGTVSERGEIVAAEVPFHDSMGHTALCRWEQGKLVSSAIRTAREPTEMTYALALFESVLIGLDGAPFLSDALKDKAGALGEFLGDFSSVVLTEKPNEIGLVYARKKNVFDVRYFRISTENGKVANIEEI